MHLLHQGLALSLVALLLPGPGHAVLPTPVGSERFTEFDRLGYSLMLQITSEKPNLDYELHWDRPDANKAGWESTKEDVTMELRNSLNALKGWIGPQIPGQSTGALRGMQHSFVDFVQDPRLWSVLWNSPSTGDRFRVAGSGRNRILIVLEDTTHNDDLAEQQNQPDLLHLSDFMNMEWCHAKLFSPRRTTPYQLTTLPATYLLKDLSWSQESLAVMHYCLHNYHTLDDVPVWPNSVVFPFGTRCFNALLATKSSQSVAWMLINYKQLWPDRVLTSVLLFRFEGDRQPSMMWTVNKADEETRDMLCDNTSAATRTPPAPIPHAMLSRLKVAPARVVGAPSNDPGIGSSTGHGRGAQHRRRADVVGDSKAHNQNAQPETVASPQ